MLREASLVPGPQTFRATPRRNYPTRRGEEGLGTRLARDYYVEIVFAFWLGLTFEAREPRVGAEPSD